MMVRMFVIHAFLLCSVLPLREVLFLRGLGSFAQLITFMRGHAICNTDSVWKIFLGVDVAFG